MLILAIETSCDDTAVAVLEASSKDKVTVLSNVVSSQVKLHAKYGGIFPMLAAREHAKNIDKVYNLALKEAGLRGVGEMDLISVTRGPGLVVSLLVGVTFAKTLAWKYKKPLVGVNHLEGHIVSNWLKPVGEISNYKLLISKQFPALCLLVSGGHTSLVLMKDYGQYQLIGETQDDAVGECFDKVARLLGLGYPGGPIVSLRATQNQNAKIPPSLLLRQRLRTDTVKLWRAGKMQNYADLIEHSRQSRNNSKFKIKFPRPMLHSKNFDFSFAGLKTAVLYKVRDLKAVGVKITDNLINEICDEFQKAAAEVLIEKTISAAKQLKVKSVSLSGGVSANRYLREELAKRLVQELPKVKFSKPHLSYTTDNAAMIGLAGYLHYKEEKNPPSRKASEDIADFSWKSVLADANLSF